MTSEDLSVFGFDPESWNRLRALLLGDAEDPDAALALIVLFVDADGAPLAALHSSEGAFAPEPWAASDLARLCESKQARACFVMDAPPPAELDALVSKPHGAEDGHERAAMRLLRLLDHGARGALRRMWPSSFANFKMPGGAAAQLALDVLLPPDHCLLLGVFEDGEIWTGMALHRGAQLDVLAGPAALRKWSGQLGGDWRRDQRVVLRAVERELGSVHLAGFMARPTAERLFRKPARGSWSLAYATKELIVQPVPAYAATALAFDGLAGAAQGVWSLFEGMDKDELSGIVQGFWRGLTDNQGFKGLLDLLPERQVAPNSEPAPPKDEK